MYIKDGSKTTFHRCLYTKMGKFQRNNEKKKQIINLFISAEIERRNTWNLQDKGDFLYCLLCQGIKCRRMLFMSLQMEKSCKVKKKRREMMELTTSESTPT
jgi:hypothetical protein